MPWAVRLIADDQVSVTRGIGGVTIAAPPTIAGKLEVRGLGIVDLAPAAVATGSSRLVLVVDLTDSRDLIERMPEWAVTDILGTKVACLKLYPFDGTAAVKLVLAVLAAPATL